jgi:hypothetical protein
MVMEIMIDMIMCLVKESYIMVMMFIIVLNLEYLLIVKL